MGWGDGQRVATNRSPGGMKALREHLLREHVALPKELEHGEPHLERQRWHRFHPRVQVQQHRPPITKVRKVAIASGRRPLSLAVVDLGEPAGAEHHRGYKFPDPRVQPGVPRQRPPCIPKHRHCERTTGWTQALEQHNSGKQ